jgi:hypothetical protein
LERLRNEHIELLRLRGKIGMLQARVSELSQTRARGGEAMPARPDPREAPPIQPAHWANVGLGTPLASYETLSWAKANRDTNVIANLAWADEISRSRIEAAFASAPESVRSKYGSADAYVLSLFDHPAPDESRRVVGYRVLNENIAENDASILVEEQWRWRKRPAADRVCGWGRMATGPGLRRSEHLQDKHRPPDGSQSREGKTNTREMIATSCPFGCGQASPGQIASEES